MERSDELTTSLTVGGQLTWLRGAEVASLTPGRLVGEGASGAVYRVEGQSWVLKVALDGQQELVRQEARLLAMAPWPGVARLCGADLASSRPRLLLEYLPNGSLDQAWRHLDAAAAYELGLRLLRDVGHTLLALHGLGFTHGDVKPGNLVLRENGSPALIDLGLATPFGSDERGGTPRYLAVDGRTGAARDEYALALTVAELLRPELRNAPDLQGIDPEGLPTPFDRLLGMVLRSAPRRAPLLSWLAEQAASALADTGLEFTQAHTIEHVRMAYLTTRLDELRVAARAGADIESIRVRGVARNWLLPVLDVESQIAALGSTQQLGHGRPVGPMGPRDRSRFFARLVGPSAADWPTAEEEDDDLLRRIMDRLRDRSPKTLLLDELREEAGAAEAVPDSPVALAFAVSKRPVDPAVLRAIEKRPEPDLRLAAARALRQRGELQRAAVLLETLGPAPQALVERAVVMRRLGDPDYVDVARRVAGSDEKGAAARAAALLARHDLETKGPAESLERLKTWPGSPEVCETRALALLYDDQPEAAREAAMVGLHLTHDDEALSRLRGVLGMISHQVGDAEDAAAQFRRAVELSVRAGAALEEATYLTGLAAAESDRDRWSQALEASTRSELLFEALGQQASGARALVTRASVLAACGAEEELRTLALRGIRWARQVGDHRCVGFLYLCLADGLSDRLEIRQAADEARRHLPRDPDRLRAEARRLLAIGADFREVFDYETLADLDARAAEASSVDARAEWWKARAECLLSQRQAVEPQEGEMLIKEGVTLAALSQGSSVLGPSLMAMARLALSMGRGEQARMLLGRAALLAERFMSGLPQELAERAGGLSWVLESRGTFQDNFHPAQFAEVEGLLRALGQRDGLAKLLRRVLDMLLLWTGVQRGMVLLRAPGERLVVRAARNLARDDLVGEQMELSRSIAQRALARGEEVVMVDGASGHGGSHKSVAALRLRSVLAAPLTAHGETLGVLYLDDRLRRGAFGDKERSWIRLIGTVAALAIVDERDRLRLRRSARRALRAESRLERQLQGKEAQLELARRELSTARQVLMGRYDEIVADSASMRQVLRLVDRVAQSDVPVLVTGESGTGKELVARAIAKNGVRAERPFVAENCSAVPETLLETTLFGHVRGAFTGASKERSGLFRMADGGTLFLDEIGEMSLAMQAKLLRVLQDGQVRPVGAERAHQVDVRILVATHRDLGEMVRTGTFREDLLYRLKVVEVALPPLRERREDILPLTHHFLTKYGRGMKRTLSPSVRRRLEEFSWPGNVRQLENEVRRMLVLGGEPVTVADLSVELREGPDPRAADTLKEKVDALERRLVLDALEEANGNRSQASRRLGLSRYGLQKMIQRLGIEEREEREGQRAPS